MTNLINIKRELDIYLIYIEVNWDKTNVKLSF